MNVTDYIEKSLNYLFAILPQKKPDAQQAEEVKIIAHRGAHDHKNGIIENTLAAFESAGKHGCWGSELDIHFTKDEEPVVHHDPDLHRLFKNKSHIKDLTLQELRAIAPEIPTLEEVIKAIAAQQVLFIELKTPIKNEQRLQERLKNLTPGKDYFLISLDEKILANLHLFPKSCQLLIPVHNNTGRFCQLVLEKDYAGVVGHFLLLHNGRIKSLKESHKFYGVGFIESRQSLYRELNRGIPWIFTNKACLINQYINELK